MRPDVFVDLRAQRTAPGRLLRGRGLRAGARAPRRAVQPPIRALGYRAPGRCPAAARCDAYGPTGSRPRWWSTTASSASTSTRTSCRSDSDEAPGLYRYEVAGPRRMQFAAMTARATASIWPSGPGPRLVASATSTAAVAARRDQRHVLGPMAAAAARAPRPCRGALQWPRVPMETSTADVVYVNVPEWLAVRIAESLGQELVVRRNRMKLDDGLRIPQDGAVPVLRHAVRAAQPRARAGAARRSWTRMALPGASRM